MLNLRSIGKTLLPRRRYRRIFAKPIAWFLLRWFTNHRVFGRENFPPRGPYIVAGNHRGIMEVFLMVAVCPRPMEALGAGDIPLDPRYRYVADFYGYIPYNRGQMDRPALAAAARVLREGGIVGIFPEGGIWKAGEKSAHRGVAWLSFTTGAPVVPVGFGGVYRAIGRAIRLEKPRLETWVGEPIPVPPRPEGTTRREHMTAHAQRVLREIDALVPDWDKEEHVEPEEEIFDLEVRVGEKEFRHEIAHPETLSEFFHTPVLVDVLYSNLKRHGVSPFRHFGRRYHARAIAHAVSIILGYTLRTNTAFFTYRLGHEKAQQVTEALFSLRRLALGIANREGGERMRIVPIHRFRMPDESEWVVRRRPPKIDRF